MAKLNAFTASADPLMLLRNRLLSSLDYDDLSIMEMPNEREER